MADGENGDRSIFVMYKKPTGFEQFVILAKASIQEVGKHQLIGWTPWHKLCSRPGKTLDYGLRRYDTRCETFSYDGALDVRFVGIPRVLTPISRREC